MKKIEIWKQLSLNLYLFIYCQGYVKQLHCTDKLSTLVEFSLQILSLEQSFYLFISLSHLILNFI